MTGRNEHLQKGEKTNTRIYKHEKCFQCFSNLCSSPSLEAIKCFLNVSRNQTAVICSPSQNVAPSYSDRSEACLPLKSPHTALTLLLDSPFCRFSVSGHMSDNELSDVGAPQAAIFPLLWLHGGRFSLQQMAAAQR